MQDPVNLSGPQRRRGLVGQALGGDRAIDHDGLDPHAVRRDRRSEIAGTILPGQIEYLVTSCDMDPDQVRKRRLVAVGRGNVAETQGSSRLGGAAANRHHRQPRNLQTA